MVKNLDILLDNDFFTAEQERVIRREISYDIIRSQFNNIGIRYQIKKSKNDYSYVFFFEDKIKKEDAYKHILYKMIVSKEIRINCENLRKEVKILLNKLDECYFHWEDVCKCQDLYNLWSRVNKDSEGLIG